MKTDRELMQQVFDAMSYGNAAERQTARLALRERLAQPEEEPVERECKSGGLNVYWYATHGMIQVTFE